LQSTADVVLRGYWGYNSRWAVQLLPHIFPSGSRAPNLVTILLGSNDAVLSGLSKGIILSFIF
jgi:lysophospholipase L1-like esterase